MGPMMPGDVSLSSDRCSFSCLVIYTEKFTKKSPRYKSWLIDTLMRVYSMCALCSKTRGNISIYKDCNYSFRRVIFLYSNFIHERFIKDLSTKSGKTTTIRRKTFRETCVPRHHGSPLKILLKPLQHHSTMVSRRSRGTFT